MITLLTAAAFLQVVSSSGAAPAITPSQVPTCAPAQRRRNLPPGDDWVFHFHDPDSTLTPLLDSLVQLWSPEYVVIDPPYSAFLDSVFDHRVQVVTDLWALNQERLLKALATIIVDYTQYGLYFAEEAAWNYRRLWGKERPLLASTINDWDYSRVLAIFHALRQPLSDQAQDVVLGLACDAAWQLQAVLRDSTYHEAYLEDGEIYWPRGALFVVDNARRRLLTGAHLAALEVATQGTEGKF